jgi:hypothetical protein
MASRLFDEEFSAGILATLKRRDILGRANPTQLVPLWYNVNTEAEGIVQKFHEDRRSNPLLETTPPEAWLAAELMPIVLEIRAQVIISETLLVEALQRYFRGSVRSVGVDNTSGEQQLCTSVEPCLPALKRLLMDLYDRRKRLCDILQIRLDAFTFREALAARKPSSPREQIILQGINEGWKNHRIAVELDKQRFVPRDRDYKSYTQMLRTTPQNFYSMKCAIKNKYRKSDSTCG